MLTLTRYKGQLIRMTCAGVTATLEVVTVRRDAIKLALRHSEYGDVQYMTCLPQEWWVFDLAGHDVKVALTKVVTCEQSESARITIDAPRAVIIARQS